MSSEILSVYFHNNYDTVTINLPLF